MRRLEDHISPQEIASLPMPLEKLGSGATDEQQLLRHLQDCRECLDLAEAHGHLMETGWLNDGEATGGCPDQTVWLEYAAGAGEGQSVTALLRHAGACRTCARLLRESIELMQTDQLDADAVKLESATPEWQERMALQLTHAQGQVSSGIPVVARPAVARRVRLWMAIPFAAAAVLTIALTGLLLWPRIHPSDATLLAEAYNEQRNMAVRIPGGQPVAMASGTRGATPGLSEPVPLLELKLRAQRNLDRAPNNSYWHQVLGEINLLEGDGAAARRNLEIAQTTDANLRGLEADLAAAWFEIAETTGNTEYYAQAAELYSREIQAKHGEISLLLYNRALCWERQNLRENALDDLREALTTEKSAAWRKEMQKEIDRLSAASLLAPADEYERALDKATTELLPHWDDSAEARVEIAAAARLGLFHGDAWLTDWMAARHDATTTEADEHLAGAVSAGDSGDAVRSLTEARAAAKLYRRAGDTPGLMRAELGETYALQRLDRNKECLAWADRLRKARRTAAYAWIETQDLLEWASCANGMGDLSEAERGFRNGVKLSASSHLPDLGFRAFGGLALVLAMRGARVESWNLDAANLARCDESRCSPIRKYAFLYLMVQGAEDLGMRHVAAEIMRNAETVSAAAGDETAHAYALEILATLSGRAGDFEGAARGFEQLARLSAEGNAAAGVPLYQAEWDIDRAEILNRKGDVAGALSILQGSAPAILNSPYQYGRVHYFTQMSVADMATGRRNEALSNANEAVRESESSLGNLKAVNDRERWSSEHAPVYAQLMRVYLERGDDGMALAVWERFRRAPYSPPEDSNRDQGSAASDAGAAQVIVLAHVDGSYVGWLVAGKSLKPLRTVTRMDGDRVQEAAVAFYRLCSDRSSSERDIRLVGSYLYASLLEPLLHDADPSARHVWLDVDPSLALIPFAALPDSTGQWLGDRWQITMLPSWWSARPSLSLGESPITRDLRMLIVNGFGSTAAGESESNELAQLFPYSDVRDGGAASSAALADAIAATGVFHFSGHASLNGDMQSVLQSASNGAGASLAPEFFAGVRLRYCRLAVLAACNTAAADSDRFEDFPDLRVSLLRSGAHAVIASNWDVDDRSTHKLMLSFYRNLLSQQFPAQALQNAQRAIQSSPLWQHPYYWASFQLFGS
jgi:CHAT domain-containing protein